MAARDAREAPVTDFRHGLVIGKFLPPHQGHLHLIATAAAECDFVTVLVCSIAREPIAGALRFEWMQQCVGQLRNVRVIHVTDEVPQAPEDSPDFWPVWVGLVRRVAGFPDAVFTSEAYGDELAARLGCEHRLVDLNRGVVPVSGSAIRTDPMRYWEYIPPAVRPHYVRRVAIVGPESTGKTTLASALADHFETAWVPEYGRAYTDGMDMRRFTLGDIERIASGQLAAEEDAATEAHRLLFCDTDVLTTATWSELYFGSVPPSVEVQAQAGRYWLTLRCDIDVPWVQDGTREMAVARKRHQSLITAALVRAGRRSVVIRGLGDVRLQRAIEAVRVHCLSDQSPHGASRLPLRGLGTDHIPGAPR